MISADVKADVKQQEKRTGGYFLLQICFFYRKGTLKPWNAM